MEILYQSKLSVYVASGVSVAWEEVDVFCQRASVFGGHLFP